MDMFKLKRYFEQDIIGSPWSGIPYDLLVNVMNVKYMVI